MKLSLFYNKIIAMANMLMKWFTPADEPLLRFFAPLLTQIKAEALRLGKDNLQVGLDIMKEAAIRAAAEAASAPSGQKAEAAEEIFMKILREKGVTAIHNAQAGMIKAAVAIIQTEVDKYKK